MPANDKHLFNQHFEEKFLFSRLTQLFTNQLSAKKEIVFLCIGIDRSAGDSFGPLTGTLLKQMMVPNVVGTLEKPVHAKNLLDIYNDINRDSFVVAIDASLGGLRDLGHLVVKNTPLYPGKAMGIDLPAVGDLSIILNVNICGISNYLLLQNSSLYMVWKGAATVARSISTALYMIKKERLKATAT